MKNILFYTHPQWVFGKVHTDLSRLLLPEFKCDVMDWALPLPPYAADIIREKYDLIVTTPEGVCTLTSYGMQPEEILAIAHSDWDLFYPMTKMGRAPDFYDRLRGFAVICPFLQQLCFTYGISRVPRITPIGVFSADYKRQPSTKVETIGYFGKVARHGQANVDIKRGWLVERVAKEAGVTAFIENSLPFNLTEGLYRRADVVMFCSLIEGNPYVALESFAAGVPVLGTGTGIFPELAATGGGGILPFDEDDFVSQAVEVLNAMRADHRIYELMSEAALEAVKPYDWHALKPTWVDFLHTLT
jgi:hypothetical protein